MEQLQANSNSKKRAIGQRNSRFLLPQQNSTLTPTTNTTSPTTTTSLNSSNTSQSLNLSTTNTKSNQNEPMEQHQETSNQLSVDEDFDSYWEEEARCPHRNRIRIGRQYQPSVPPLLKPGESDNRDLEDLETLTFCPKKSAQLSDAELDHYFTIAKSLNLFASLVETRSLLGRDVTIADLNHIRNKEGLSLASVIQPPQPVRQLQSNANATPSNNSPQNNNNKSPPTNPNCDSSGKSDNNQLETSNSQQQTPSSSNNNNNNREPIDAFNLPLMKALSHFINLHHPCHHDRDCKKLLKDVPLIPDNSAPVVSITAGNLRQGTSAATKSSRSRSSLAKQAAQSIVKQEESEHDQNDQSIQSPNFEEWTREEVELFSKAIEICGKNFSSIKKEFLPSKSVKSIVEYYYIGSRDVSENKKKQANQPIVETSDSCSSPEKALALGAPNTFGPNSATATSAAGGPSSKKTNNDPRMSVYNFDEELKEDSPTALGSALPGAEVKPLKAKPIIPHPGLDPNGTNPNVGSLEFFMDGQLVLKLNACQDQQEGIDKCHWVQSGEKVASERRQKKYAKRSSDKVPLPPPAATTTTTTDAYRGELFDNVLFDQRR